MGLFSSLLPVIGGVAGSFVGAPGIGAALGGALAGATGGSKQSGTQTTSQNGTTNSTSQQQVDPRIANLLFGQNGNQGLLNQFAGYLNQPQNQGSQTIGDLSSNFLNGGAGDDINAIRNAGYGLIKGNQAPAIGAAQFGTTQVQAPSQNNLDLSGAYNNFINGNAGENPYLLNSLKAGTDLSNAAYQNNVNSLTDTLQRQILPSLRGGAIASGTYGGSRQGIAEGNALSDFTKQLTNANTQQSLANTQGILGAQAGAFNQGQDRSLNALNTLSGQQYNTANTNAQLAQNAALQNAQLRQQADLANAGFGLQNNAQNNASAIAGSNLLSGNLNQLYGYNQNANNAGINRALQVGGLLSPFLNVNSTTTQNGTTTGNASQPLYTNPTANAIGTAGSVLGLYNQFAGNSNGSSLGSLGSIADLFGSGKGGTLGSSAIF